MHPVADAPNDMPAPVLLNVDEAIEAQHVAPQPQVDPQPRPANEAAGVPEVVVAAPPADPNPPAHLEPPVNPPEPAVEIQILDVLPNIPIPPEEEGEAVPQNVGAPHPGPEPQNAPPQPPAIALAVNAINILPVRQWGVLRHVPQMTGSPEVEGILEHHYINLPPRPPVLIREVNLLEGEEGRLDREATHRANDRAVLRAREMHARLITRQEEELIINARDFKCIAPPKYGRFIPNPGQLSKDIDALILTSGGLYKTMERVDIPLRQPEDNANGYGRHNETEARRELAKVLSAFAIYGHSYTVVTMPSPNCQDFAKLLLRGIWEPSENGYRTFTEVHNWFCDNTPSDGTEIWIEMTGANLAHVHVKMPNRSYFDRLADLNVKGNGYYLQRGENVKDRADTVVYSAREGFVQVLTSNIDDRTHATFATYGLAFQCQAMKKEAKIFSHGGHLMIRRIVDNMHCRTWNLAIDSALTKKYDRWIDVGSKYLSMATKLYKADADIDYFDHQIYFVPYRPNANPYDQEYHRNNEKDYDAKIAKKSFVTIKKGNEFLRIHFVPVVKALLVTEDTSATDLITLTDAHYYFLHNPLRGLKIYSGITFPTVSGIFRMPDGECVVKVTQGISNAQVLMATRSNGYTYKHDWVVPIEISKAAKFGYLGFVHGSTTAMNFVKTTRVNSDTSETDWEFENIKKRAGTAAAEASECLKMGLLLDCYRNYECTGRDFHVQAAKNRCFQSERDEVDSDQLARPNYLSTSAIPISILATIRRNCRSNHLISFGAATTASTAFLITSIAEMSKHRIWNAVAKVACNASTIIMADKALNGVKTLTLETLTGIAKISSIAENSIKNGISPIDTAAALTKSDLPYFSSASLVKPESWWDFTKGFFFKPFEHKPTAIDEMNRKLHEITLEVKAAALASTPSVAEDCLKILKAAEVASKEKVGPPLRKYLFWTVGIFVTTYATAYYLTPIVKETYRRIRDWMNGNNRTLSPREYEHLLKITVGAVNKKIKTDFLLLTAKEPTITGSNLLKVIEYPKITSLQNAEKIQGENDGFKVEKPIYKFNVNKNLIKDNILHQKIEEDYILNIKKSLQPEPSGFQYTIKNRIARPHCYDPKSLANMVSALFDRQVGTLLSPDLTHVNLLNELVGASLKQITPYDGPIKNFKEWLDEHDWTATKRKKYVTEFRHQMGDNYDDKYFRNEYDLSVKNLEIYHTYGTVMNHNVLFDVKDRPRPIMVPNESLCGVITWMQQTAFIEYKTNFPEFVHGEDSVSFWKRTYPDIETLHDPVSVSLDGGSHDSHQHKSLIKAVDHQI